MIINLILNVYSERNIFNELVELHDGRYCNLFVLKFIKRSNFSIGNLIFTEDWRRLPETPASILTLHQYIYVYIYLSIYLSIYIYIIYIYMYIYINCYLTNPQPALGNYLGGSLTLLMLVTAFFTYLIQRSPGAL